MSGAPVKVEVEELEACKRRVAVEAPADVVQTAWERAYVRVQRQARLPGFRKGHVPRSLVKLHFADDVRREVAEHLIPDVYRQAVAEAHLDPVNEPNLESVTLEENAPLSFVAVVEVKPAITLGEYRGLEVEHAPAAVTDEDVEKTLQQMREQHAEFRAVDRPAATDDLVVVDYTLSPEGHEPTTATGYPFVIGSGAVMPEIDAGAAGLRAGDAREVALQFPEDHRMESLRGKPGTAALTVREVKEKVLPALDDEFAKLLGQFESLDQVRAEIRKTLQARLEVEQRHALEDKIVGAMVARHDLPVPEALVMRQIAHQLEHTRERLRRQGLDPDTVPWDVPKLVAELRPGAEQAVRRALLLEAIADRESIAVPDEELAAEVDKIAAASQRPAPAVRRMMEKSGDLDTLRHGLRERKTLEFLIEHASIRKGES